MRLLLDTHAFLWAAASPSKLSDRARRAIEDRENDVWVSAAVAWELALKYPAGKLPLPMDPAIYVPSRSASLGFAALPITHEHAFALASLPAIHTDPFDRIMLAQAQYEGFTFVTRDARALTYPVHLIEA